MKRLLLLAATLTVTIALNAQSDVTLFESQMKVGGLNTEIVYYGLEGGDQVTLTFADEKGKEMKEVEIFQYPSNSLWMEYKTPGTTKTVSISERGIYGFRFKNSATGKRIIDVKIVRTPGSSATQNFNTGVVWRNVTDTTYYTITEQYVVKADTTLMNFYNTNLRLEKFADNYPYMKVVETTLPENIDYWGYYIGVGNAGKYALELGNMKVEASDDTLKRFGNYDALYATAFGIETYIEDAKGNNNVEATLISDAANVELFKTNQPYSQYWTETGEVLANQVKTPNTGKIYIGLTNRDAMDAIDVIVKIVGVQIVREYATREVEKFKTNTYSKPFHAE